MTAEGARGCAWRAAGRRCRGCRHADVSRHRTQPYRTVPYSTVPYCVLPYSRNIRQSISYPVSLKESQGERKPLWETGENVENSVESVWKTCFKALRPLRAGAAGSLMDTFGRTWSGGGRSGGQERRARAWMRWGRRRFWRRPDATEHGGVPTGGMCGCGRGFRPGAVWRALSAGAGVTLLAGALWRPCGAGRGCSAGRAGWLSCREKKCLTSYAKAY